MLFPQKMLMRQTCSFLASCIFVFAFVPSSVLAQPESFKADRLTDDQLLTLVQEKTFQYFWDGAEANSGWARERIHLDEPAVDTNLVTSGGTGFGLMAILVGIDRGMVTREQGVAKIQQILHFAENTDRFHGVWPHWLDGRTGKTVPFSTDDDGADLVESSFLAAGLICISEYFAKGSAVEVQLSMQADRLWREIDWSWHQGPNSEPVLYWHWSPTVGWKMNFKIRGYNECLITYFLAASSPTHGVEDSVFHQGWAEGGSITQPHDHLGCHLDLRHQGTEYSSGPLYWAHYSFLGLDPRGLKDRYTDYWQHNQAHVQMNRAHCLKNPAAHKGYGDQLWGLTSSYSINFYNGHAPENDNGTISPTAALSSFPYLPQECMKVTRNLYENEAEKVWGKYGFYDAYNPSKDYHPPRYLAIDQGPIVVMIENYRTGLLWKLFMRSKDVKRGLRSLNMQSPSANDAQQ